MKRYFFALILVIGLSSCETLSGIAGGTYGPVTETEAAAGIREALDQGVSRGISLLNKEDGFLGNEFYKILLPAEAVKIENTLRQLGMGSLVDRAIIQINRAAEDAVGHARPIFVDAIRQMTIADALTIIKGPRDAATQYFKNKTTQQLITAFSPIIKSSLDKFSFSNRSVCTTSYT